MCGNLFEKGEDSERGRYRRLVEECWKVCGSVTFLVERFGSRDMSGKPGVESTYLSHRAICENGTLLT